MINLSRLLKIAQQRILRNPYNAIAAVAVLFLAFFISGAFILVTIGSNMILGYFESRPEVIIFLKDNTTGSQVKKMQQTLTDSGLVSKTRYVSKEEALQIYKGRTKDEPLLNEFVTSSTLPASIEVSTYNLSDHGKIVEMFKTNASVDEITSPKDVVDKLSRWSDTIRISGVVLISFLLLTAFLITLIVIGLNISIHQDEIEIMKLVGATSGYVRTPFIFEGVFYGAFSSLLASIFLFGIFILASPTLNKTFAGIPILPSIPLTFFFLLLGELLIGVAIGVVGSFVATKKYLSA